MIKSKQISNITSNDNHIYIYIYIYMLIRVFNFE